MAVAATPIAVPTRRKIEIFKRSKSTDPRFQMLLFGQPGIGKTTFGYDCHAASGKSLILAAERGYDFLGEVEGIDIAEWSDFTSAVEQVDFTPYDTVVVDTALGVADLCQFAVCKTMGITHPEDTKGKAYDQIALLTGVWFHRLSVKCKNVIWIAPERPLVVKNAAGVQVTRLTPDIPGTTLRIIANGCQFIGHAQEGKDGKRAIDFRPTNDNAGKDRKGIIPGGVFPLDGRAFWELVAQTSAAAENK